VVQRVTGFKSVAKQLLPKCEGFGTETQRIVQSSLLCADATQENHVAVKPISDVYSIQ